MNYFCVLQDKETMEFIEVVLCSKEKFLTLVRDLDDDKFFLAGVRTTKGDVQLDNVKGLVNSSPNNLERG